MITAPIEVVGDDADATGWTSLDDVKEELGIEPGDLDEDALLRRRIARASKRLVNFTNLRGVAFQQYKETLPGMGGVRLMVSRVPIVNLIKVEVVDVETVISGDAGTDITSEILLEDAPAGFLYRKAGWSWSALSANYGLILTPYPEPLPGTEEPVYRISYEAGWTMPGQTKPIKVGTNSPEVFPEDLAQAVVAQVVYDYRRKGRSGDVRQKKVGDTTISYEDTSELARRFGLAPDAFYLANSYRRAA